MTDPGNLTVDDADDLKEIRTGRPELDAVTHHVRDFAAMMRDLRGDQLPAWMDRVLADHLPALHSLVNGLSRDIDAVTAGLSTPGVPARSKGRPQGRNYFKGKGMDEPTSTSSANACSSRPVPTASQDQRQSRIS
ncbi:hypothetical protein AB0I68_35925 [Streptomyces sp. NPDC050448]|uniref:hypothetical protein n=1 Tax=Streptomyces sp. NPDC050448 TaxID=3155404 RepID=UPI00341B528A